jgi:hypothetical protein
MLFRETVAVYCENHTEHINTLCGQNVRLFFIFCAEAGVKICHILTPCSPFCLLRLKASQLLPSEHTEVLRGEKIRFESTQTKWCQGVFYTPSQNSNVESLRTLFTAVLIQYAQYAQYAAACNTVHLFRLSLTINSSINRSGFVMEAHGSM